MRHVGCFIKHKVQLLRVLFLVREDKMGKDKIRDGVTVKMNLSLCFMHSFAVKD